WSDTPRGFYFPREPLPFVSVFAGSGRERSRHVFNDRARSPVQNGFERSVELILQFLGDTAGILSRTRTVEKVAKRSRALIFLPGPFPDHPDEFGPIFANFLFCGAFDLFQMRGRNAEAKRDTKRLGRFRLGHGKIWREKVGVDNVLSVVYTWSTVYTHGGRAAVEKSRTYQGPAKERFFTARLASSSAPDLLEINADLLWFRIEQRISRAGALELWNSLSVY